jgi:hypothetical protein
MIAPVRRKRISRFWYPEILLVSALPWKSRNEAPMATSRLSMPCADSWLNRTWAGAVVGRRLSPHVPGACRARWVARELLRLGRRWEMGSCSCTGRGRGELGGDRGFGRRTNCWLVLGVLGEFAWVPQRVAGILDDRTGPRRLRRGQGPRIAGRRGPYGVFELSHGRSKDADEPRSATPRQRWRTIRFSPGWRAVRIGLGRQVSECGVLVAGGREWALPAQGPREVSIDLPSACVSRPREEKSASDLTRSRR